MPAFQAINVEPEENLDDEIDNTRQIHIDEALKRFQTALKLHAQGPRFFDEATDAYDDLFKSDIFQYPEAATEYERAELPASQLAVEASLAAGIDIQSGEVDGADSTLPQALFLAHKNHGQFLLDRIKHTARRTAVPPKAFFQQDDVKEQAQKALLDFNAALDRDPSDAELWRRIARVAGYLNSGRIRRYCLEAAIELDDDPTVEEVEPPSLAEGLAGEELKEHLQVLSDDMGLSHPILGPWVKHDMPALIKRHLDPIPFLPNPTKNLEATRSILTVSESKISIRCPTAAWSELGMALVQLVAEVGFTGKGITIDLPNSEPDEEAMDITDAIQKQLNEEVSSAAVDVGLPDAMDVSDSATKTEAADETATADGLKSRSEAASAPARKRSQSVAGLAEAGEDENAGEKRSKRIRRRETAGAGEVVNSSALHATQLAQYQAVDQHLFQKTKDVLENIGVTDQSVLDRIGEVLELCTSEDRSDKSTSQATIDLKSTITSFSADNAKILINKKETDTLGMSAFLEHAKGGNQKVSASPAFRESHGLGSFAKRLNAGWTTVQDMAWEWLKTIAPSYVEYKWSDMMKAAVVHVISRFDQDIYEMAKYEIEATAQSKHADQELMRIHNLEDEQEDEQEDETMGGVDADVEDETMEAHEEDETLAGHEDETLGDHEDETLEGHEEDETMEGHEEDETIGGHEEDDEEAEAEEEEEEEEEDEEEAEEGDEAEEAEEGDEAEEDEEAEEGEEDEAEEAEDDGEEEDEEEEEEEGDSREVADEDEEGSEAVEMDG
ncbi:hypothetical protein BN1723_007863 [Verticillium longisporum]|uniref:Histone transcription regulator 3 homolog n=1 Tax=Verticillium longisporum TaxID=100787 RepID=A0A0G4NNE0_VERLO|nr:hypothetical protein BN1723_007863 [Verticillium longisporum]